MIVTSDVSAFGGMSTLVPSFAVTMPPAAPTSWLAVPAAGPVPYGKIVWTEQAAATAARKRNTHLFKARLQYRQGPRRARNAAPCPTRPAGPAGPRQAPAPASQLKGGAAILAPISSFPNGVPGNALVLLPINPNGTPLEKKIVDGPVALQMEEVWKLLGFNGPAVQVQDEQGRPIAIGLEDLLGGLEKHWNDGAGGHEPRAHLRAGAHEVRPPREGREGARRRSSRSAATARTGWASASRSSPRRSSTRPRRRSRARRTC